GHALWILATVHEAAGDVAAAIAALRELVDLDPESQPTLARLADLLRSHQRFAEAAAYRRRLVERDPAGPHAWALMSEAAIAGEWSWVREVAARLDLSLDPGDQGPLDYPFGRCKIRFDEGGADLWGERRGPVSARVLSIVGPRKRERYRDLVVLDTTDLREPSETSSSDQRRPDVPIFRALATIERAEWRSFTVDGPNPGEAEIDLLRSIVRTLDGELSDRTNPKRRLRDREAADPDTKALPAFYAFIAVSPSVDLVELDFCLEALVDTFERPLAWTELAHALPPGPARDAALERNERIVERFGL
ncbi:MAG: tetratricopeptide repeat protein, partial [Myxococcales bacterium]|nr:tetratricopeptide repeat protein [Myxococcales bacterium]